MGGSARRLLFGARGGAQFDSDAERRAVFSHLRRHAEDIGMDAPEIRAADSLQEKDASCLEAIWGDLALERQHKTIADVLSSENVAEMVDLKRIFEVIIDSHESEQRGATYRKMVAF